MNVLWPELRQRRIERTKLTFAAATLSVLAVLLCVFAVVSTFPPAEFESSGVSPLALILIISVVGLGSLLLGYASVVIFGGMMSLGLAEFVARVTRSKHVIEMVEEQPRTIGHKVSHEAFPLYLSVLVFILSVTLSWDLHSLHDPRTSIFHPLLHALDIFSKTDTEDPILHCINLIPAMTVTVAIAGVAPSMAIPYFRKFKVTGVNSGPFHTSFLSVAVGAIVGLGTLLALIGFIYQTLWVGTGAGYYHYILPVMLGLSLLYAVGALLGRNRSEDMVKARLEAGTSERIVQGTVSIREI